MTGTLAHFGIRTRRLDEMIRWYSDVLTAEVVHRSPWAAFLTFDHEHHRLVLWTDEATVERAADAAGVDHVCLALSGFPALAARYQRLKTIGIVPSLPVNHRFTTSLYYRDPDGNELELSVDNFATKEEGLAFVRSEELAEILVPPFGHEFDPEELVEMVRAGASDAQLRQLGRSG